MRADLVRRVQMFFLLVIVAGILVAVATTWLSARAGQGPDWLTRLAGPSQVLAGRHIGIVAGHSGNDSGTVCDDGLTEASVNMAIAEGVVKGLQRLGAQVDLLEEYDDRLGGYQADAFLSIHTDSCQATLTGFKIAGRSGGSAAASERLTTCIWDQYEAATKLARNPDTITDDMRIYHAFHQIAAATPAAIIETGFLNTDRAVLTTGRDQPVNGIIAGIKCFLVQPRATATATTP
jgi:N-acetylmuramoyl-L-alanine amidase